MSTKTFPRVFAAIVALAFASVSWGYVFITNNATPIKWPAGTVPIQIKTDNATVLSDGTTQAGSIQAAIQAWNAQLGTLQFSSQIVAAGTGTDHNYTNEIFFSGTVYGQAWDSNTLAVTTDWYAPSTSQRTEADIIFNTAFNWDSYRGNLKFGSTDYIYEIRRVAIHELGHVLGLDHPDEASPRQYVNAIMNSSTSNLDSLQSDDIAGAQFLYGEPNAAPSFAIQPVARTVYAGQSVSFTAGAIGNPIPSHQWERLPSGSSTWSNLSDTAPYVGTGTSNLTVGATLLTMSGDKFRCVATNAMGSATSLAATLTVNAAVAPSISGLPSSVALSYGETLSFTPTVSGTNPITFQWNLNGIAIAGATAQSYLKYNVSSADGGQYTLTATNSAGPVTSLAVAVTTRAPVNIVRIICDPFRSLMYGLQQEGINAGSVVVIDPVTAQPTASIPVGKKPADLSISADGNELLVICSADPSISVIDLRTLQVTGTIALPNYGQWGVNDTSAHIKHGAGNIIYYTDGTWAPTLRVLNRSSSTVLQALTGMGTSGFGFGDIGITPDGLSLFAWGQYGWTAGSAGSNVAKLTINADGTLTDSQTGNLSYPGILRDPLNTPVLIASNGSGVFMKQFMFAPSSVLTSIQSFPSPVLAISPRGEIAVTATSIHETATGNVLYSLPSTGSVQAISADSTRLVYFDATARQLKTVDLIQAIGATVLGLNLTPADGAVILPPSQLQWTPQVGITRYRVYLGTSQAAVDAATTSSPEYLGEVIGSSLALGTPPAPGSTYYWRVDAVSGAGVSHGPVFQFTVASISSSLSSVKVSTVSGDKSLSVDIALSSATAGKAWTATASAPWITFTSSTGTTPATLKAKFDTTALPAGLNQASITITGDNGSFSLPVKLTVDPLALTVMRSTPGSTKVYAISEEGAASYSGSSRAYLLEIDTLFKRINRVVRVGTGVTDLAIHQGDGRIYVTNWKVGSLLAVDLGTFNLSRTFAFTPFGGVGSSSADVYRVSAGNSGRLVTEPKDQWINISLFDTVGATSLATIFQREGGGAFDPAGRYYYHGDNNISNATLHKFDTNADKFTSLGSVGVSGANYYGDRTVVMAENGRRVFWNGAVFDENLAPEWTIGSIIYSASSDGRYAFGANVIYDVAQKQVVGTMPAPTTVSAFSSVTGQLVFQNGTALQFYALPNADLPQMATNPGAGAIVEPPSTLQWTPLAGAIGYRVYFGLSSSAVQAATTASPEYLGQTASSIMTLPSALIIGQTYYWRVDYLVGAEVATGTVRSFTVSYIITSLSAIDATTVKGDSNYSVNVGLSSATAGKAWTATASAPWITFANSTGTTPATLQVKLDTTALPVGVNQAAITITSSGGAISVPVKLTLDPLALTVMRSAPGSTNVYAISEENAASYTGSSRAYLLEIDTVAKRISRVVRTGTGVTDLAVHKGDGRVYVTNWKIGSLLAIDLQTFSRVRTYPVTPFNGTGYSTNDVYRISAGGPGRLVVEAQDQWINVSIFDTATGTALATRNLRQGGGAFDPAGRYYYHGDDNISNASLHKLDSQGTTLLGEVGNNRPASIISYYGDRTVVMADTGRRIFWNGVVFDENLVPEWTIGAIIYSTSSDGGYAFGSFSIYDVAKKQIVGAMPVTTKVSAFNSTTGQLVLQNGSGLLFYGLTVAPNDAVISIKIE